MIKLKKPPITLNCQVVGFDIGCHEAVKLFSDKFNEYHRSWSHNKYSWHTYNASWQPMSKPTTWPFNLILCQVVMTKTSMSYLHSKCH